MFKQITNMPTYTNAIGYIRELGQSEGIPWLEMICDLAGSGETTLSPINLEILIQLFINNASYLSQPAPPATTSTTGTVPTTVERLESIGPFSGFKRLNDTLVATFPKRVTIVFGANGSGKSSICEALQILASSDAPRRPLKNVRVSTPATPSFAFKFTSDVTNQTWTSPAAYGLRSNVIKYFDNDIAVYNIKNNVQPGRIIELSPFKLDVFETAKNHCETLRRVLQQIQRDDATRLTNIIEKICGKFETFKGTVLASLDLHKLETLDAEIKLGESYSAESGLEEKLAQKAELTKAASEEGLKLLKGEVSALKALCGEVQPFISATQKLIEINPIDKLTTLKEKEIEQETIAKVLIPTGATLDKLMTLIRSANMICNLYEPEIGKCPLCKQDLGENEISLFKQYAALINGSIDKAITELREILKSVNEYSKVIADSSPDGWAKGTVLPPEIVDGIKVASKVFKERFKIESQIDKESKDAASYLNNQFDILLNILKDKENLIEQANRDREDIIKKLDKITSECNVLLYANKIAENIYLIKEAQFLYEAMRFWDNNLPNFTTVLRKITSTAKKAHKELVVNDFKTRLNAEYLALAEKAMIAFGVELRDVGDDANVTVDPHVCGEKIDIVLSEGEQRIHALALFFAELETCRHQVIVFDDPVSSFDYNYITNYCNRLRNLIQAHQNRQIIILTHNWEFFVQIQITLNKSALTHDMAVHVLESCVAIDEYSEKIDVLKGDIESILTIPGEPSKQQKEIMAGKMRRLIEAIVNTHVFNNQRHQFKQKSQQISVFDEFTRLVPLLPSEAQTLRDLYAKLSITEHDDPQNAYVNTDKAMFQTRYDGIKNIKTAIIARKQCITP